MTNLSPLLADISSNNSGFNALEYRDSGHIAIAIKATEGVNYVNPDHRGWCLHAGLEHLSVIHYHFARPDLNSNATTEAQHFLRTALPLAGGRDFLALDIERATPGGWSHDPGWSKAFDTYVQANSRFRTILYAARATLEVNPDAGAWLTGDDPRIWDPAWNTSPDYVLKGATTVLRQQSGVTSGVPPYSLPGIGPCDVNVARGVFLQQLLSNAK